MNVLYIIPARSGSKRLPNKNIKNMNGKTLLCYSIDVAREVTTDEHICVSTDSEHTKSLVETYGLKVPFLRPSKIATDQATTNDVISHALEYYKRDKGVVYDAVVLLQPTSPMRTKEHLEMALGMFNENIDMVVSVKKSHSASVLCQENEFGFVELIFNKKGLRAQEVKEFYEYNGSIYVINVKQLLAKGMSKLIKRKKMIMSELYSIDIDTAFDFELAEHLLNRKRT